MKIKLINPNTTLEMTESIRLVAEKYKAAGDGNHRSQSQNGT